MPDIQLVEDINNTLNPNIPYNLKDMKKTYKKLIDNIGFNGKGVQGHAIIAIMFIGRQIVNCTSKEQLLKDFPNCMAVLNKCLQIHKFDVRKHDAFRILATMLVRRGLEDLTWIPN